ncbi:universal stress protein [Crassaminicella profunda]|uniref:universal stress protein n=1 Tax=Crassaminicella profunda TaxID=1286698 RepID=UPI001CA70788|nr:universal stress protein [Crassaminicella profunda]QZY53816.1 universal stress protein [Crassaminicella profunda]
MKKILIAYDGSDNGRKALLKGKEIAEKFLSDVMILYVVDDQLSRMYSHTQKLPNTDTILQKIGEQMLQDCLDYFKGYQGNVYPITKTGNPAAVIIETAEEKNVDLIFIGSRGLSRVQKILMGSVSNKVANYSNKSVVIVK